MTNQMPNQQLATPLHRFTAFLIDALFWLAVELVILLPIAASTQVSTIMDGLLRFIGISFVVLPLIVPLLTTFLTSKAGGSIGKLLTGIAIINTQGQPLSFKKAFFRNYIAYMVSGLLFWLGFIWIFVDKEKRGWHDLISDTLVVIRNQTGLFIGLVAAVILLGANIYLAKQIVSDFKSNSQTFTTIIEDIVKELETTPTPTPSSENVENGIDNLEMDLQFEEEFTY